MYQRSEAAWKEIIKNKPSKVTAFDEYKDFCKNLYGRDITNDLIKNDWATTMNQKQKKEFQNKADVKNQEHENNVQNWLNYYGVTQEQVDEHLKVINKQKYKQQKEKKKALTQLTQEEFDNQQNEQQFNQDEPQKQKQAQNILRKVKKENKQPNQKSVSPDPNEIIHQQPILVRKKNVQLEKQIPIHKQSQQKQVRFELFKEESPSVSKESEIID